MSVRIAPSILSADFTKLGEEIKTAEAGGADFIHVDVMDGRFVPNITVGPVVVAAARRATELPLDVHLMIDEPERYIDGFAAAGASWLSIHFEACRHLHRSIQQIKSHPGVKAGVAINPATSVLSLEHILWETDFVLVMSVNPGFGGQTFIRHALDKVRVLRGMIAERELEVEVEVDGGVSPETIGDLVRAGAQVVVAGSAVFGSGDVIGSIEALRFAAEEAAAEG